MGYIDFCSLSGKLRTSICITVTATAVLTAGNVYAACTVGGGAPIDGFAVGASVACPTGTVNAGTLPPDGSTITNKNAPGATTTFTYTRPGGGVGTVQLAGIVNLTAASVVASDAGQAAAADNAAMVDALFGGGAGGATTDQIPVDTGIVAGPVDLNRLEAELNAAQSRLVFAQREFNDQKQTWEGNIRSQQSTVSVEQSLLESIKLEIRTLESDQSVDPDEYAERYRELQFDLKEQEQKLQDETLKLAAMSATTSDRVEQAEDSLERAKRRVAQLKSRISSVTPSQDVRLQKLALADAFSRPGSDRTGAAGRFATSIRLSELLVGVSDTRLGQTETGDPIFERPARLPSRLDMFANVSYSKVENDANGAGYESKSWQGTVGIDYRVTQPLAIGVFTAFTSNDSETRTIDSDSDSFSYLVGPFARFNLTRNLTLSSSFSMGKTSTDLRIGTTTSSFDSTQSLATLGLRGSWSDGPWTIAPQAGISYSTTETDRYTDSAGNVSAERTRRSGAITAGPTISYLHSLFDSGPLISLTPSLGIRGVYNYKHAGDVTFNNGVILTSDDLSASVTPGLGLSFDNGASASFSYTHSGLFADIDGWSVTGGVSAPIEVLIPGLNETASANLQFTAEPQVGPSFVTRFVIPFN